MKFYHARQILMISSKNTRDNIYKSKSLLNRIKKTTRFVAIGLACMSAWMVTSTGTTLDPLQSAYKYPRPTLPPYLTPIELQSSLGFLQGDLVIPVISAVVVVIAGLVANHIISRPRKKSSQLFE